jgi:hypothetical protein
MIIRPGDFAKRLACFSRESSVVTARKVYGLQEPVLGAPLVPPDYWVVNHRK